ncbi:hypothetical protein BD410DRAFT_393494 [Rickenella mellea]|uniref:Uncharacterized protein n=1 Tax=Rickenella mellea TaxID=50990 RepID=A0A4Y7PWY0_9AGAM|nr:hypothetical protein BD410DRAFT_393494 [Rickenella mellea]
MKSVRRLAKRRNDTFGKRHIGRRDLGETRRDLCNLRNYAPPIALGEQGDALSGHNTTLMDCSVRGWVNTCIYSFSGTSWKGPRLERIMAIRHASDGGRHSTKLIVVNCGHRPLRCTPSVDVRVRASNIASVYGASPTTNLLSLGTARKDPIKCPFQHTESTSCRTSGCDCCSMFIKCGPKPYYRHRLSRNAIPRLGRNRKQTDMKVVIGQKQ